MLRTDYRYISFDFETTGLDTIKDEPLQIGIVEFDSECTVIQTYQSLIKPTKPINELKEIVRYVTWFKLEDLKDAPSYDSLLPDIRKFFDERTVIVWQNISFDLAFLHRILPNFVPVASIDIFHRSKIAWHYQPSYALDVIAQMLLKKWYIDTTIIASTSKAHDALHDSLTTLAVRKATLQRIHKIRRKYLLVDYCIQRNDWIFLKLLKRTHKDYKFDEKELFFPPLKKNLPPERSLVHKNSSLSKVYEFDSPVVDASQWSLHTFLESIDRSAKQRVVAVNSRSKATLIKKRCDSKYINHVTLKSNAIFDPTRINFFLHQNQLSDSEIWFIIKYYSHHLHWHSSMDLNTGQEYMIFDVLTSRTAQTKNQTIITTHDEIIWLQEGRISSSSHLLFFDNDRRIQSLKRKVSQPFDMYSILNIVERNQYEKTIIWEKKWYGVISEYSNQLTIFLWLIGNALDEIFRGQADKEQPCDFLLEDTRFTGLQPVRDRLLSSTRQLKEYLTKDQYAAITWKINRLEELLTWICECEKRMYHGDKRNYVLKTRDPYLDREELLARLPQVTTTFISLKSWEHKHTLPFSSTPKRPQIVNIHQLSPLDQFLWTNTSNCFVFSWAKHISQSVFKHRISKNYQEKYTIVGENITWWVWKNLYLAQQWVAQKKPLLAIGGYHFFMPLTEKNFAFPTLCMYYSKWTMTPQIVTDFVRWSR